MEAWKKYWYSYWAIFSRLLSRNNLAKGRYHLQILLFSPSCYTYSFISPLIKLYRVSSNTDWPHCKNHKPICNDSMLLFQFGYRSDWSNGLFDPPKTVSRRDQDSYLAYSTDENVYGSEKSMQNYRMEMIMIWFSLFKCRIMNMGKML